MNTESRSFRTFGIRNVTLVILLTILAGFLRFQSIDKPAIWGDEAATWRRVCGTYQELLDELRTAGFMPANYLLTWWIKDGFPVWGKYEYAPPTREFDPEGRWFRPRREAADPSRQPRMVWTPTVRLVPGGVTPTPLVMRFIPALCGTLMVPAMYFLASRLVSRRTALLVALFTCCSAYMLNYSRDAKMYAQFWFCATLHVGCLLWWLEAYRRKPPEESMPRRPWSMANELGAGVSGVLGADHVGHVARAFAIDANIRPGAAIEYRVPRVATFLRFACWLTAGLAMISFSAVGLAILTIELLIVLATIPLRVGWVAALFSSVRTRLGPSRYDALGHPVMKSRWTDHLRIPPLISFVVGAWCIISLFSSYKQYTRFYARVEPATTQSTQYDVDDAGISWVEEYNEDRTAAGHFLENATAFLMSWEWPKTEREAAMVDPEALARLKLAATVLLIAIVAGFVPWKTILDRMTSARRDRGPMPATSLFIVATWLGVAAYGMYAASGAWTQNGLKERAIAPVAAIASAVFPAATSGKVEPLRGALMPVLKQAAAGDKPWKTALSDAWSLPWRELFVVHTGNAPIRWWAVGVFAATIVIGALGWRRPRLERYDDEVEPDLSLRRRRIAAWWGSLLLQGTAFGIAIFAIVALLLLVFVLVPAQEQSVWMPRYLGFVWPAFAIAICVLIRRLPFLPLRWLVIAALLLTNLTVFYFRVNHGEPPTAEIARDQIAAGDRKASRVFAAILARGQYGGPGAGGVYSMSGAYYYLTMSGTPITPRTTYNYTEREELATRIGPNAPNVLRATVRRDRSLDDIFVWAQLPISSKPDDFEGRLAASLAPGWSQAEPMKRRMVYDHWTWKRIYVIERHHWSREPTTQAATKPAG